MIQTGCKTNKQKMRWTPLSYPQPPINQLCSIVLLILENGMEPFIYQFILQSQTNKKAAEIPTKP